MRLGKDAYLDIILSWKRQGQPKVPPPIIHAFALRTVRFRDYAFVEHLYFKANCPNLSKGAEDD
jgi:hypothetical protein